MSGSVVPVIGVDDVISVTPTITSGSAYSSGHFFGAVMTLTDAFRLVHRSGSQYGSAVNSQLQRDIGKCVLQSVSILDKSAQNASFTIYIFDRSPTVTSADRATLNISASEMDKCLAIVDIDGTYSSATGASMQTKGNLGVILKQSSSATDQNLYAVAQIKSTATYTSTSAVTFRFGFYQD